MALICGTTVRVDVGPEWYELKTELGWYEQRRIDDARARVAIPLEHGNLRPDAMVNVSVSNAERDLLRLEARLVRWSHSAALITPNIRLLPAGHAHVLLDKIAELEAVEDALALSDTEKNSPSA